MKTITVTVEIQYTIKPDEDILKAIKKGIYWGLDVKNIAQPKNVNIIEK